jgi:predicted amidohydrolase
VQLNSRGDVSENLAQCGRWANLALKSRPDLILLPENFAFLGSEAQKCAIAERLGDVAAPIQQRVISMARRTQATVVAGGFPERSADPRRPYNTCAAFAPSGRLVAAYRKIHMFDADLPSGQKLRESETTTPGLDPAVAQVRNVTVGLSVCYDLRFPELYRAQVDLGAELLLVPAAFTSETGPHHWQVLLRARAIESSAWVVAANQWGEHGLGRISYGHSSVVDPWGTVVAELAEQAGVVTWTIDLEWTKSCRQRLPSLQHRRLTPR